MATRQDDGLEDKFEAARTLKIYIPVTVKREQDKTN
tara:strand:- start:75 stop:182 length:108 start_codon:yes stop_codon:yes gene_type:complete